MNYINVHDLLTNNEQPFGKLRVTRSVGHGEPVEPLVAELAEGFFTLRS